MKTKPLNHFTLRRTAVAALALSALFTFGAPQTTQAATTSKGATILNVVTVAYTNAGGTATATATASASVLVNLLPADLLVSAPPTAINPGGGLYGCTTSTVASGTTATELVAIVSNANGEDSYTLTLNTTETSATVNSSSIEVLSYNGSTLAQPTPLGSAVIVGVKDATTLYLPAGSVDDAGFSADDIVVVTYVGGAKEAFLVASTTAGTVPSHGNPGGAFHSDDASPSTDEEYDELVLKAYAEQAVGGYTVGGTGNSPTFTTAGSIPADGTVVGELAYVKISINANSEVAGATGTIDYTLDTGANDATCSEDFTGATLQIKKEVANSADNVFGATATGKPTDTLIYRVTVTNASGVTAGSVTITDAVPTYTTLVTDAFAAGIFAQADLNASGTPSDITALAGDADDNTVASGSAPNTAAGQPIIFYIGASNDGVGLTGGSLDDGDTVVITYKVTID